jgi:YHS domain-containing protein
MSSRAHIRLTIEALAAAALCLAWHAAATAQSYDIRPNCNSSGSCYIRPGTYGYNDTWWRQWPTQYRPEVSDPRAVGAGRLPAPPGLPEAKLPAGGVIPSKPPLGGEGSILPGGILPSSSGSTAPARQPHTETPGDRMQIAPSPDGALSIPGIPSTPNLFPGEGGTGPATLTPRDLPTPNLGEPNTGPASPKSSEKEPAKSPDLEKPSAKPPEGSPSLKPDSPAAPGEFHLPQPTAPSGALPRSRRAGTVAADPGAPGPEPSSSAARPSDRQSEPDGRRESNPDRALIETSFEQRDAGAKKALHNALEGYCPVELRNNERWVAGRSELRINYQGQLFRFSSEAAKRQFAAAPEKYAPANGGNDAVLAMEENRAVSGSIQHSAVWHEHLYLFASSANLAAFREDPARYAKRTVSEPSSLAEPNTPAEANSIKRSPKAEESQRLRLPGDSL